MTDLGILVDAAVSKVLMPPSEMQSGCVVCAFSRFLCDLSQGIDISAGGKPSYRTGNLVFSHITLLPWVKIKTTWEINAGKYYMSLALTRLKNGVSMCLSV